MTDKTLPEITNAGALDGTETLYIVQGGNSREVTLDEIAAYIATAESIVPENLPWRGCRVNRTSDATGLTFPTIVSWQAADVDTDAIWSAGDPTKLTVPAGVTKVRLTASVAFEVIATAGMVLTNIRKNLTGTGGDTSTPQGKTAARNGTTGFTTNDGVVITPVLDVVAGDYFDLRVNASMSGQDQVLANNNTWFEMEIIEADVATP